MARSIVPLGEHTGDEKTFREFIKECEFYKCPRPGNYAAPFHAMFKSPRVRFTFNKMLQPYFAGAWQEALTKGQFHGEHFVYDIRSAYFSALGDTLPDPETYRYSDNPARDRGLYVIEHEPRAGLPYPFNVFGRVNATADEIEIYGLRVKRIIAGLYWGKEVPTAPIKAVLRDFTFWKSAARAYWGRWAMMEQVQCVTDNSIHELPNVFANLCWAHLIVGKIRMRLWHETLNDDVRHVFNDSIISINTRTTGLRIGDWSWKGTYPDGINIRGAGCYGPFDGLTLDKMAGVPLAARAKFLQS